MWSCETKVGITCLIVICGSANTVAFAAAILQWEEMVVSLTYGVIFFGTSIFVVILLFSVLVSDSQKGMTIMMHACKTRPLFLLIFLGLFNAELRGVIEVKYERPGVATQARAPGPSLRSQLRSHQVLAAASAAAQLASNRTVALNSMVMRRQLDGIDENGEEHVIKLDPDVIMYLSCGLFICNVVIDAFVVKRLSVYAAKMSSLPLPGSGSNQ
ncbi:uncharacterized protein LOC144123489 isoform X1 [Amblyomma americanum]